MVDAGFVFSRDPNHLYFHIDYKKIILQVYIANRIELFLINLKVV